MKAMPLNNGWIPVTERVPAQDVPVLGRNSVGTPVLVRYWSNGDWADFGSGDTHSNITHWAPLPELPEERGDAEHDRTHRAAASAARDIRYVVSDDELARHRTLAQYREMLASYLTEYIRQLEENTCSGDRPCPFLDVTESEPPRPSRRFKGRLRLSSPEWPLRPPRRP